MIDVERQLDKNEAATFMIKVAARGKSSFGLWKSTIF